MATASSNSVEHAPMRAAPPPLEPGDRLTRAEFERRYEAMPGLKKAELIDGVVYMPSPVRLSQHGRPHGMVMTWLGVYVAATPGVTFGDNSTVRLDLDNEPQPDALLMIGATGGGQARIGEDGYVEGAPELVVEIASSSVSYDLHAKFNAYRRAGVREYVAWRVIDGAIDWFDQVEGRFEPRAVDAEGLYRSAVFPGLLLDPAALLRGDLGAVLDRVRRGVESPEHAAFVARLAP